MQYLPDETALTPGTGEMWRTWNSGDYWGKRRPMARATIQKVAAFDIPTHNGRYKTLLFEQSQRPVELPNVRSVTTARGIDTDAATLTIELWNVAPLPYGTAPTPEHFERPGWYSPNRGAAGNPWGDAANQWADMLVENRVVRTFQGYGVDPSVVADEDIHLLPTGTWLIDTVAISSGRVITLVCRDMAKVLIDQIAFPPIIPTATYPISFHSRNPPPNRATTGTLATSDGGILHNNTATTATRPKQPISYGAPGVPGRSLSRTTPPDAGGAGAAGRKIYSDYTDVVRYFCALAGFYWPAGGYLATQRATSTPVPEGVDPMLGEGNAYGDFQLSLTTGVIDLKAEVFDKKPLMDGVAMVRDILGFNFFVDEHGGAQFRMPNVWLVRNAMRPAPGTGQVRYTAFLPSIDGEHQLTDLTATLSDRNGRSNVVVANSSGQVGASVNGREPHPMGLDRVAVYTDQHFATATECRVMADLIAMRYVWSYRSASVTIPGCPMLQPDDQVRIFDRDTGEFYVHYVKNISTRYDAASGSYTSTIDTNWLGTDPGNWTIDAAALSPDTQNYLAALKALVDVGVANQEAGL